MEFREFTGKTVEDAVTEASIALGTTSVNIEYEIITEGKRGLFSKKDAVIKARVREEQPEAEEVQEIAPVVEETVADNAVEEAPEAAEEKPAVKAAVDIDRAAVVKQFVTDVIANMGMPGTVDVEVDDAEKEISVNIGGENARDVIGNRGLTLDALQYLASNVVNRGSDEYYRVKLDAVNYRERRKKTLENLAKNTAAKVKKTRRKVALNPMNPYERRIIHAYLQSDSQVTTKSEGVDPRRRVVVYYKR